MLTAFMFFLALLLTMRFLVGLSLVLALTMSGKADKAKVGVVSLYFIGGLWALFFYLYRGDY